jgi:hypothetical protein
MRWLADSGSIATLRITPCAAPPPMGVRLSSQSAAGIITMIAMNQSMEVTPVEADISVPAGPSQGNWRPLGGQ